MGANEVKKGADKERVRTRCYYSDYVNHAIRFYLTTPDTLMMQGKRKADVENWMAVQAVFYTLNENDTKVLTDVYKTHYRLAEAVRIYCEKTGTDSDNLWVLIAKVGAAIAKRRGLI